MVSFPASMSETMIRGDGMKIRNMISVHNLDVQQQDEKGNTLLHYALLSGNEDTIRTILELNPDPKVQNKDGKTPLEAAKNRGFILPEDITFQLNNSDNQIHEALIGGNELQIRNLIATNGLNINKPDKDGNTLLHLAVLSGNESSVKAILDLQPDPTIKNKHGDTPLELAKAIGGEIAENTAYQLDDHLRIEVIREEPNTKFVKSLVLGGADPHSKDSAEKSAISILESGGRRGFKSNVTLNPNQKELKLLKIIQSATQQKELIKKIKSFIQGMRKTLSFNLGISPKTGNFISNNKERDIRKSRENSL